MRIINKEVLTGGGFLIAFIVFTMSSYGVGKAESDNDKPLKDFSITSLFISIAVMVITWFVQYGIQTPSE